MAETIISGLVEGGKATSGPPFGPALGPLGVNIAKIIKDINTETGVYSGIKVPVKVIVNGATKEYRIEVGSPPTSALILKEIGVQKGAKTKDEVAGNATLEQLKNVLKAKENKLYGTTATKIKQLVGTCKSMNITVEGMPARDFLRKIEKGEVKNLIGRSLMSSTLSSVSHADMIPKPFLLIWKGATFLTDFRKTRRQYFLSLNASKNFPVSASAMPARFPYLCNISWTLSGFRSSNRITFSTLALTVTGAPESLKYTTSFAAIPFQGERLDLYHLDSIVFSPERIFPVKPHDLLIIATCST